MHITRFYEAVVKRFQAVAWILLLLLSLPIALFSQIQSDYQFKQFTTDDGLPSSEVHCVIQDSKGYMWFGTDNGVARFDGYNFKTFGYAEGLGNPVVFEMFEDENGLIYFATMDGKMYVYNGVKITAWRYNYKIDSLGLGTRSAAVKNFDLYGWTTVTDQSKGLAHIHSNGKVILPVKSKYSCYVGSIRPHAARGYISGNTDNLSVEELAVDSANVRGVFNTSFDSIFSYSKLESHSSMIGSTHLGYFYVNDTAVLCGFDSLYISTDLSFSESKYFKTSIQEIRFSQIGYLASCDYPSVLLRFDNVKEFYAGESDTLVSGFRCTDAILALDGSVWATSVDKGVLHLPGLEQVKYSSLAGLDRKYIQSFAFYQDELVLSTRNGNMVGYNLKNSSLRSFPRTTGVSSNGHIYICIWRWGIPL
ncbi:MAG: two-component regulator propeller domain-containing protein [Saprospiraceae bacterium]